MGLLRAFGPEAGWPAQDLVALSDIFDADLALAAYRSGVFPMPIHEADWPPDTMGWWSPLDRAILPLDGLRVTRSLRKSARRYRLTVDQAFGEVMRRCAEPSREGGWIDADILDIYGDLHERGFTHSIEAWTPSGELAGGLYGVSVGGLFAGESMFHDPEIGRDASKVALLGLVAALSDGLPRLLDVQWLTDHLASLGATEVERPDYLNLLDAALDLPGLNWPAAAARVNAVPGRNAGPSPL